MVIKYQIILLKYSKMECLYVVYLMCILDSHCVIKIA